MTEYFVGKARAVLERAGGDPDVAGPLAAWAQSAHAYGDPQVGVVVARDGVVVASTRHTPAGPTSPGATYVRDVVYDGDTDQIGRELGLALTVLARRRPDAPLIYVRYSEVCQGPDEEREAARGRADARRAAVLAEQRVAREVAAALPPAALAEALRRAAREECSAAELVAVLDEAAHRVEAGAEPYDHSRAVRDE